MAPLRAVIDMPPSPPWIFQVAAPRLDFCQPNSVWHVFSPSMRAKCGAKGSSTDAISENAEAL